MCRERGLLPAEVPDRLVGVREVIGEEAPAVELGEDAGVTPALAGGLADLLGYRPEVEDVDDQQVARLGALDGDRPGQHVTALSSDVAHVVGRVVVADLGVGPLPALDADRGAGLTVAAGDVRVPPVVTRHDLVTHRLGLIHAEHYIGHSNSFRPNRSGRCPLSFAVRVLPTPKGSGFQIKYGAVASRSRVTSR